MQNYIEKDSPLIPLVLLLSIFLMFLGGGFSLAYAGGVFTGKNQVIANDQRIEREAAQKIPVAILKNPSS